MTMFLLSFLWMASAKAETAFSIEGERLMNECRSALDNREYELAKQKGNELQRLGAAHDNETEALVGEAYRLRAAICLHDTTDFSSAAGRLDTRLAEMADRGEWRGVAIVARTLAQYHHFVRSDFSQASRYAFQSLDANRRLKDAVGEVDALSTLASIYFSKNDSSGWNYARESYDKAKTLNNYAILYTTACNMANYLYNKGDFDKALAYLEEAAKVAEQHHYASERAYIESFFGDLYAVLHRDDEAEAHYKASLDKSSYANTYDVMYAKVCYAQFLLSHRRFDESMTLLKECEEMADKSGIIIFMPQIYGLMSQNRELAGDTKGALEYYKRLYAVQNRIFTREKEREFAVMELRHRISEEQNKNAEQKLELLRRSRTNIVVGAIAFILLAVIFAGFMYHRRRMKDYRDIVRRHLEYAESERKLREQFESDLTAQTERQQRASAMTDERQAELYGTLLRLMENEKLYRQTDLTLDKAAAMLQTNRTYLSKVVNDRSGMSFTTFVNSYRLKEAEELLSDPSNTDALKSISLSVGFSTPTNFYNLFRQRVGVSPSVFRENVKNIKEEGR